MSTPDYPQTRSADVVDILHGETIADPYRWLEDGSSSETRAWTERQNAVTEAYLAAVPGRERIRRRLEELLGIGVLGTPTPKRGRYFYLRRDGHQNQPVLYWRDGFDGTDRVAVDPNALNEAGTTALDWYYPSEDGRLLAYGLSEDGNEESVLHLLEVGMGRDLPDRIPRMRAASVAWLPDSTGFYYTRYPAPEEVPEGEEQYHRALYFHRLGADPATDPLVFKPAEKEYWPGVSLSPDGRWLHRQRGSDVRPDRSLSSGPRIRGRTGSGCPRPAGVVRGRNCPRASFHADQPRCPDVPAVCRWIPSDPSAAPGARLYRRGPTPYWRASR